MPAKSDGGERIRVVLVDDHPVVRQGTKTLLEQAGDIEVVGVTGEGLAACRMVAELHPDVLALDVRLPDISGVEVARRVRATSPGVAVLVLTGYEDVGYRRALVNLGVKGYLHKTASGEQILAAIRALARGESALACEGAPKEEPIEGEGLTPREREVLELLVAGRRNQEIAEAMTLSLKTVEFHISNLLQKLGARSRAEAIRNAVAQGLASLDRLP